MKKTNERWQEVVELSATFATLQDLMHQVDDLRIKYDGRRMALCYQQTNEELQKVYDALSDLGWHIVHEEVLKDKPDWMLEIEKELGGQSNG